MAVRGGAVRALAARLASWLATIMPLGFLGLIRPHWTIVQWILAGSLWAAYALMIKLFRALSALVRQVWNELSDLWVQEIATAIGREVPARVARFGRNYRYFERNYRTYIKGLNRFPDRVGMHNDGPVALSLDDVFVDVSLAARPRRQIADGVLEIPDKPGNAAARKSAGDFPRKSVWNFLGEDWSDPVRLAIIGGPGSGKTTLLKHVVGALAHGRSRHHRTLPVLLQARDCATAIANTPAVRLPDVIASSRGMPAQAPPKGWFERRLAAGQCVIMLDSLDEVAREEDRHKLVDWVNRQVTDYPGNDYLVTSRPHGYRDYPLTDATELQVREFTPAQRTLFVCSWYLAACRSRAGDGDERGALDRAEDLIRRIDSSPALDKLAVNPLLLRMMVNVDRNVGALPETRANLYAEMCYVLLMKRHSTAAPGALRPAQKEAVLGDLALVMIESETEVLSRDDVVGWISGQLTRVASAADPDGFLAEVQASGLMVAQPDGRLRFADRTFQEYLAAVHVATTGHVQMLVDHLGETWWRETTLLYAARAGGGQIVEAGLASGSLPALTLAAECADADPDLDPALRQQLNDLLQDAADPGASPERRKLAAAMAASREFRKTFRLKNGTRVCSAPVTRRLFELFTCQGTRAGPANRPPEGTADGNLDEAAVGVTADEALTFITWLNDILDGTSVYRLLAKQETEDPRFYRNPMVMDFCVWLAPEGDALEPGLWSAPGRPHPYAVSAKQLRCRSEEDVTGPLAESLVAILAFALVHALTVADAIAQARDFRGRQGAAARRSRTEFARVLEASMEVFASVRNVALRRSLSSRLGRVGSEDFVTEVVRTFADDARLPAGRARARAFALAQVRAYDLAADLRFALNRMYGREFPLNFTRPTARILRPGLPCNRAFNRALDQDLGMAGEAEALLDLPLCILFARNVLGSHARYLVIDLLWSSALAAAVAKQPERIVLPSTVRWLARGGYEELERNVSGQTDVCLRRSVAAVASRIDELVSRVDEARDIPPWLASYVRLGALAIAAALCELGEEPGLTQCYVDIAAGITALEQRTGRRAPRNEVVMLVRT